MTERMRLLKAFKKKNSASARHINFELFSENAVTVPAGGYRDWFVHRSPGLYVPGGCECTPLWRCWTLLRILPRHTTGTCIHINIWSRLLFRKKYKNVKQALKHQRKHQEKGSRQQRVLLTLSANTRLAFLTRFSNTLKYQRTLSTL